MAIGTHAPQQSRATDLKGSVRIALDEAFISVEEALQNLTKAQLWAHRVPDRSSIGGLTMHVLENLNGHAVWMQTSESAFTEPPQYDPVRFEEMDKMPLEDLPDVADILGLLRIIRDSAMTGLEVATEADLTGKRHLPDFFAGQGRNALDAYTRTTHHAMAHVRQMWFLRGLMGLRYEDGYPQQHWA